MRRARSRATRYERSARVEMLPLLDVVFLLLAVFLLSVVRMVRSYAVPVDLPQLATGLQEQIPAVLLLGVDEEGRLFVAGEESEIDGVSRAVRERIERDPETRVLVQADRNARHGEVAALLDAVRDAGAGRVLIVADPAARGGDR